MSSSLSRQTKLYRDLAQQVLDNLDTYCEVSRSEFTIIGSEEVSEPTPTKVTLWAKSLAMDTSHEAVSVQFSKLRLALNMYIQNLEVNRNAAGNDVQHTSAVAGIDEFKIKVCFQYWEDHEGKFEDQEGVD